MDEARQTRQLSGLLHELRALPQETEWVEFKHDNADPEQIGQYISALANSAILCGKVGAYVVWGIDDQTHDVIGTTFHPSRVKRGNEELESWLLRLLTPKINFRFHEFEVGDNSVVLLHIPPASRQPVQFQGIEYIRVGSYKKKLKDYQEKERALWRAFEVTPFEKQVAMPQRDVGDVLQLLDYPAYFRLLEQPLPENRDGIVERLANDHLIAGHAGGGWDILNLGAILFAVDLRQFHGLARKAVRIIEYDGAGRIRTKRELDGHAGYAVGFEHCISHIKSLLPENEVIGDALRKSVPMYPEPAVRELVANALIHQDFAMTGAGPMIELFDGRLEITNPGTPLMDTNRFLDTAPHSRNEALASFMRRVGICEERGSGIDKVVFETEYYQLPAPLFEVTIDQTRSVLFAHRPFVDMDKFDRMRACYLHACLQYVNRRRMTNASLRQRFGMEAKNSAQVSRVIADTVAAGVIRPYDPDSRSRKHASYIPYWA